MSHKILLGLIGGIGPKASNNFCNRLVNNKIVTKEQEHIPFLLFSDPNFEDRTQAILTNKIQNITNKLNNIINLLKQCNVTHIIMLCNTIHFWISHINLQNLKLINMIQLTNQYFTNNFLKKSILLSTIGTYNTNIYKTYFNDKQIIYPIDNDKQIIMDIIYNCKISSSDDENINSLKNLIISFKQKYNFDCIILGCTELSLLLENITTISNIHIIDPFNVTINHIHNNLI
jgi:aspartate racemase